MFQNYMTGIENRVKTRIVYAECVYVIRLHLVLQQRVWVALLVNE